MGLYAWHWFGSRRTNKGELRGCVQICFLGNCRFTGADISALVREASLAALQEDLGAVEVGRQHFDSALQVRHSLHCST